MFEIDYTRTRGHRGRLQHESARDQSDREAENKKGKGGKSGSIVIRIG